MINPSQPMKLNFWHTKKEWMIIINDMLGLSEGLLETSRRFHQGGGFTVFTIFSCV